MDSITTIVAGILSAMGDFLSALVPTGGGSVTPAIATVIGVTLAGGIARKTVKLVKQFGR